MPAPDDEFKVKLKDSSTYMFQISVDPGFYEELISSTKENETLYKWLEKEIIYT